MDEALGAAARYGSLRHHGPGRTDDLEISVPGESFVVPADIVSALGQGNTEAGFKQLELLFPEPRDGRAAGGKAPKKRKKPRFSAEARERIASAQRARWAKVRGAKEA